MVRSRVGRLSVVIVAWLLTLLQLCPWRHVAATSGRYIVADFRLGQVSGAPSHLQVDGRTGFVYVSATNVLFRLDRDLQLLERVDTGSSIAVNYNKVLLVDERHDQLVVCGSLAKGACNTRRLEKISDVIQQPATPVVSMSKNASTVGFIAIGPTNDSALFVAATYSVAAGVKGDHVVPAVSSRSLEPHNLMEFSRSTTTTSSSIRFQGFALKVYLVEYVYGFSSQSFSYFVTRQRSDYLEPASAYISKLVRVCHDDPFFFSYTEVPLECVSHNGVYNMVQAAYVTKVGYRLSRDLGIAPDKDVLFGVFSKTVTFNSTEPSSQSALCVFSLDSIRRKFVSNTLSCYSSRKPLGLGFISPYTECKETRKELRDMINEDFCGLDVNTPIGGTDPVVVRASLTFDTMLTSVTATAVGNFTVAFIGTSNGHVKKVAVEATTSGGGRRHNGLLLDKEYEDLVVQEGSAVRDTMTFDSARQHIYVMTDRMVSKLKVQQCDLFKTCSECLERRDPYCGWCSLENKCSVMSDCRGSSMMPYYWIDYKSSQCTSITHVEPAQIQITTVRTLSLYIKNLPSLAPNARLQCAFAMMGHTLFTDAKYSRDDVQCSTPSTDLLPPIPDHQDSITAQLSLRTAGATDFAVTEFRFYDCRRYRRCVACVSSPFPCDWCLAGHRCTHNTADECRSQALVTGINHIGPSQRSGPSHCPRINGTSQQLQLVAAGTEATIQVKVESIPSDVVRDDNFICQFNVAGRIEQRKATLMSDTIHCNRMRFDYAAPEPNITVSLAVLWGEGKALDNPDNVHIILYSCWRMADNCGECLTLSPLLRCGWCSNSSGSSASAASATSSSSCKVESSCGQRLDSFSAFSDRVASSSAAAAASTSFKWLDRNQTCANPQIVDFQPRSGPLEGGTNITISGVNLGKQFDDIVDGITVAGIACQPFWHLYIATRRIVCHVASTGSNQNRVGEVVVIVRPGHRAASRDKYRFVSPRLSHIQPLQGPVAGGTRLAIGGQHLDAGSLVRAYVGTVACTVVDRSAHTLHCVTARAQHVFSDRVHVEFDGTRLYLNRSHFAYVADPTVRAVYSGGGGGGDVGGDGGGGGGSAVRTIGDLTVDSGAGSRLPRGVPSGGVLLRAVGTNFHVIASPLMALYFMGRNFTSPCRVYNSSVMECRSPTIGNYPAPKNIDPDRPVALAYGFVMDNVQSVVNLTASQGSHFLLFPDPVFEPFEEVDRVKFHKSEYLIINGHNLNRACQENDVIVHIGTGFCNVTSLSLSQLTCKPPAQQPPALDSRGHPTDQALPEVMVTIGDHLNYSIGLLSYSALTAPNSALPKPVVVSVAVVAVMLLSLVVCVLIAFKRKSTENSRVLKNMQEQMDVLELQVAAECKEAFAELQTEMTDLTSDITGFGIPFLDYRTYCMKILFPSQDGHPVLQWTGSPEMQRREKGLRLFGQMVINKTFLLIFVRTLESSRQFSMRDRVNVASLIMVTLQSRMEYCTDVLKTLLSELIERCTQPNGSHPKLLLRRTESVAEKMLSAWFTFLLYKFLRECAGEPLYLLYRAIKQQVDKGPVDALTSEARYSLSEDKLIRQQVEFTAMSVYVSMPSQTVYVSGLDPHQDNVDVPVRVLNTDTIGQVKEKCLDAIYRSTPFSMRPRKEDLDLEWRTGSSGRLILFDEDSTSKRDSGWKRLNTLAHYRVPDGALLTLLPKQTPGTIYNLSLLSDKSDKSHKYETLHLVKSAVPLAGGGGHGGGGGGMTALFSNGNSPSLTRGVTTLNQDNGVKSWHLVRQSDSDHQRDWSSGGGGGFGGGGFGGGDSGERRNKMVSEIYLTRLLATKGTLQKFMDDLFETIFSTAHRGSALPLAIKYMFDYLDDQSLQHGIFDLDTVHTWKSNSLPLRFWVNLIKNPNFVFDINKTNIIDSCLSVVAQTFMDSCSTSDNKLGKDSPSSKLLYAKDIPIYKEWVIKYYDDIKMMPAISDQDMNAMLAEESRLHQQEFNTNCALYELYAYAVRYSDQLRQNLEEDEFSSRQRLALKLDQVHKIMASGSDQ